MKQETKNNLEIPLFLLIFLIIGIIGAFWLNDLMSYDLKKDDLRYIVQSCKKNKYFFYDNTIFKCEIQE